jgi:hypothetical protein
MSNRTRINSEKSFRVLIIIGMLLSVVLSSNILLEKTALGISVQSKIPTTAKLVSKLGDKWWQWGFGINTKEVVDPFSDLGQAGCDVSMQKDLNVIFLVGTVVSDPTKIVEHNCAIPIGMSILFPILNVACNSLDKPPFFGKDEKDQRECSKGFADLAINLGVTIDGKKLKNLENYRVASLNGGSEFSAAEKNPFETPVGHGTGVSDGYWVLLTPPSPGKHKISFTGTFDLNKDGSFDQGDVKFAALYNLDVKVIDHKHDYLKSLGKISSNGESPFAGMKDVLWQEENVNQSPKEILKEGMKELPNYIDLSSMIG